MIYVIIGGVIAFIFIWTGLAPLYKLFYFRSPKIIYNEYESLEDGKSEGILLKEYEGTNLVKIIVFGTLTKVLIIDKNHKKLQIIRSRKDNPEYYL